MTKTLSQWGRSALSALTLVGLLLLPVGPALAAPAGLSPRVATGEDAVAAVTFEVLLLADDVASPRYEAQALRRLLEATHGQGWWPVTLVVTPASLEALLGADPGLQRLLLDTRPTVVFTGPEPRDGGLAACALLARTLDVIPAAGGGHVGALLREDTPLWEHARQREAGLVTADGFVPPGRLAAGRPVPSQPSPSIDRWRKGWEAARADAHGVVVESNDAALVLDDVAAMAALAASLGLDPFAVPELDQVLRRDLRSPQPPHAWSPVPLSSEVLRLEAQSAQAEAATRLRLQRVAAVLARFVLERADPAAEAAARIAELPPGEHFTATQVLRAAHLRPGATGRQTQERIVGLMRTLAALRPRVAVRPALVAENRAQWALRSAARWETVFGTLPDSLGNLLPGEVERLHRDYRRREQRRRARLR